MLALTLIPVWNSFAQTGFQLDTFEGVLNNPTSLQFGPDGRLYVSQQDGTVFAFSILRNGVADYSVVETEQIDLVADIPNHDDDGDPCITASCDGRQVTGLLVAGTETNPVLYVGSSDPRIGAGGGGNDTNLDTNSGIVSRLTCTGGVEQGLCLGWEMVHLVRGLPRSEENHANNGMQLDAATNTLYVASGGHTNAGAPSNNFAFTTEYAYSAAILAMDLTAIEAMGVKTDAAGQDYFLDLPTLDDPDRTNGPGGDGYTDIGDPFGGNDGKNQAKIVAGSPVTIYASGFRNLYDIVLTESGRMYGIDNGANGGWGGHPAGEADYDAETSVGVCTNEYLAGEPGSSGTGPGGDPAVNNKNGLHFIRELQAGDENFVQAGEIYYGGHPTPIRGNPSGAGLYYNGTWLTGAGLPADWPPVPVGDANPADCDFRNSGETDGALANYGPSTNGITEYTASNFNGALQGDLLAAGFSSSGPIFHIKLNAAGDATTNCPATPSNCTETLFGGFGSQPLDVVAEGDSSIFPGTVWAVTYGADDIVIFEPDDYDGGNGGVCTAADDDLIDEDGDLYSNADEIDNGTNPCSAGSLPDDNDGTIAADGFKDSDLNDPDDDDDTVDDVDDSFAIDANNGLATSLPIEYELFNDTPGVTVSFFGLGFTGLIANGVTDYRDQFVPPDADTSAIIAGGTAGLLTYITSDGRVLEGDNTQDNGFQFGVNVDQSTDPFTIHAQINGPFFDGAAPQAFQSQGIQIGTGDMDNYLKVALTAGGFEVVFESNGVAVEEIAANPFGGAELSASQVSFFLAVDPAAGTVQSSVSIDGGAPSVLATTTLSGDLLDVVQGNYEVATGVPSGLAIGTIATSFDGQDPFAATWDFFRVSFDPTEGEWVSIGTFDETRHEHAFVEAGDKFYLMGGRETQTVKVYDPATDLWTDAATMPSGTGWPAKLHHFQAVTHDGLIYAVGALTGNCCQEPPAERVFIYDPVSDTWMQGAEIPPARRRGGGGTVVYNDRIYLISGNTNGHTGPVSAQFDEFNPATGVWTPLPDIPNPRDHFFAVTANDKIYVIGGRESNQGEDGDIFDDTIPQVDVFDFGTQSWTTLPSTSDIPTPRAAPATGLIGSEIVVAGGEDALAAHAVTESFNLDSLSWRTVTPMLGARHAAQAIVSNNGLYVVAGSPGQGGPGSASPDFHAFYFHGQTSPDGIPLVAGTFGAPDTLDFGGVQLGQSPTLPITVSNSGGSQAILIEDLQITGSTTFTLDAPLAEPIVVGPGESVNINVSFSPTVAQTESATLSVTHSGGSIEEIALTGNGTSIPFAIYINSGSDASYVDQNGNTWVADEQFDSGQSFTNVSLSDGDIAATLDDEIYLTERNSGSNLTPFSYSISVPSPDDYTVVLHFAEIHFGATGGVPGGEGSRVFSVNLEGQPVLVDYDIFGDVGAQTAATFSQVVNVSDGELNVDLTATVNQPKLSGIVVTNLGPGNVAPTVDPIADQLSFEGDDVSAAGLFVVASDPDSSPENLNYAATGLPPGVDLEPTNGQFTGSINAGAAEGGPYFVTVDVDDGADTTSVNFLWVVATPDGILYRVNNGGPVVAHGDGSTDWAEDRSAGNADGSATLGTPSPYLNLTPPAVDRTFGPLSFTITNSTGAPDAIFAHERYSQVANPDNMNWEFPVSAGDYRVNLYFAENWSGADEPGVRVFDVVVEGVLMLDDYDVFVEAGNSLDVATKESHVATVTDGILNINFTKNLQNPAIKGIEILAASSIGNNAPSIDPIGNLAATEGDFVTASVSAADPDTADTIVLSIEVVDDATSTPVSPAAYAFTDFGDGTASFSWQTADGDEGSYTATVTADDGTDSSTEEFTITLVDLLPTVSILAPADQSTIIGTDITVEWSATGALSTDLVRLTLNADTPVDDLPLAGELTLLGLPEGPHTVTVQVTDSANTVYTNPEAADTTNFDLTESTPLYRVNAGGPSYQDGGGNTWEGDVASGYFSGGSVYAPALGSTDITGTTDDVLYRSERFGNPFSYSFPVTEGTYTVELHFAEIYHGVSPNGSCPVGGDCTGSRIFDVQVEGSLELADYDIYVQAGASLAAVKATISNVAVTDGSLDLTFLLGPAGEDNSKVAAIAVFPDSASDSVNVALQEGWNLVSLPVDVPDKTYDSVYPTAVQNTLFAFDNGYVSSTEFVLGNGYWLRSTDSVDQSIPGAVLNQRDVTLASGWNLLGSLGCTVDRSTDISDPSGVLSATDFFGFDNGYVSTTVIEPGTAVWAKADVGGVIGLNCDTPSGQMASVDGRTAKNARPSIRSLAQGLGSITFVDSNGGQARLYIAADGGIDETTAARFALPPTPPRGTFDARFDGETRLLAAASGTIQLQTTAWPVTVTVAGLGADAILEVIPTGNPAGQLTLGNGMSIDLAGPADQLAVRLVSLPARVSISENYPNPFSGQTNIDIDLPADAVVRMDVFDVLGRRVREVDNLELAAGSRRTLRLDGASMPSGLYFYRITVETGGDAVVKSGSMTIVR